MSGRDPLAAEIERAILNGYSDDWPEELRGDEYAGSAPQRPLPESIRQAARSSRAEQPEPIQFDLMDSAALAAADFRLDWHCPRILVRGQPCVVGGPKKAMKTSLVVDLAISLGTGTSFLGQFIVQEPTRVAVLSAESGPATLKEIALRVCNERGLQLASADVFWGFRVPQLADPSHIVALQDMLAKHKVSILFLDPLYLSLLAGVGAGGLSASNLYQIGPLLLGVTQACLEVGCTPVLVHHFRLTRSDPYSPPQLEDLAFSGIQEFARQWILLGRRERYEDGTGQHRLWLSAGGSAGHSGLWAVDVEEGVTGDDFTGRRWRVDLSTASEIWEQKESEAEAERREKKVRQDAEDDLAVMATLDGLDPGQTGAMLCRVRDGAGISRTRAERSIARLLQAGIVRPMEITFEGGKGSKRTARGLRRREE